MKNPNGYPPERFIPLDQLRLYLGKKIKLGWAKPTFSWVLLRVENNEVVLARPGREDLMSNVNDAVMNDADWKAYGEQPTSSESPLSAGFKPKKIAF